MLTDKKYREDQFYSGVTYNFFGNQPMELKQNGFSIGLHGGFIRDIPVNKARNIGFGVGIGLSFNGFNNNILIAKSNTNYSFTFIDKAVTTYSVNRFSMHMLELPLEFRWRTSTLSEFKFWRIYSGFKLGYVFYNSSKFEAEESSIKLKNIEAFNKLQYGLHFSIGYNTWNFYFYYSLNPIFNSNSKFPNGNPLEFSALKAGLMFYIL